MKKKIYILTLLMMSMLKMYAQDTLFYESFNSWDALRVIDSIFTNEDEDGLTAANALPNNWFVAPLSNGGADSTEFAAISASWIEGYLHGNRNWLTLPGIPLGDSAASLSWRSAPALGDLYLDGYKVIVCTDPDFFNGNNVFFNSIYYSDTLMTFAENMHDNPNDFSQGVKHSDFDLNAPMSLTTTVQYPGIFTSWNVDLSSYKNETVYITFLHDSNDDNYLAIDDIVVTGKAGTPDTSNNPGGGISGLIEKGQTNQVIVWPSIFENEITIALDGTLEGPLSLTLLSMFGQLVEEQVVHTDNNKFKLDLGHINSGAYLLRVENNKESFTTKIIKK